MHDNEAVIETRGREANQRRQAWRWLRWGAAGLLLLMPWAAMQFRDDVTWDTADFVIFGLMLGSALGGYELAVRASGSGAYRAAVGVALAAAFVMVWMNLAVGIIGSEENPANWLFAGVLGVGLGGAVLARFRAAGMARALVATAVAQGVVCLVTAIAGWGYIFVLTAIFIALWWTSSALFRRAARAQAQR